MFSSSGDIFARHFQSVVFLLQMRVRLSSLTIWIQRGTFISKIFPQATKSTTSFLFSSDVYLGWAEHPSLCPFDSCEFQDDLILSWVAQPYLDSNWVYTTGSGQMFVSSAPLLYIASNWCVLCVCQQINKTNKNKLRPALKQHYFSFFVLGQWI